MIKQRLRTFGSYHVLSPGPYTPCYSSSEHLIRYKQQDKPHIFRHWVRLQSSINIKNKLPKFTKIVFTLSGSSDATVTKPGAKNVISVVWGYLYKQSIFVNFDKVDIRTADLLARNKEETVVLIYNI